MADGVRCDDGEHDFLPGITRNCKRCGLHCHPFTVNDTLSTCVGTDLELGGIRDIQRLLEALPSRPAKLRVLRYVLSRLKESAND